MHDVLKDTKVLMCCISTPIYDSIEAILLLTQSVVALDDCLINGNL